MKLNRGSVLHSLILCQFLRALTDFLTALQCSHCLIQDPKFSKSVIKHTLEIVPLHLLSKLLLNFRNHFVLDLLLESISQFSLRQEQTKASWRSVTGYKVVSASKFTVNSPAAILFITHARADTSGALSDSILRCGGKRCTKAKRQKATETNTPVADLHSKILDASPGPIFFISGGFRGRPRRASPLRPKIFSISCSFSQILAKSYVGAPLEGWRPLLRGLLDLPLFIKESLHTLPGSATVPV